MIDQCPKCGRPAKQGETACARCGLMRTRWPGFQAQPLSHPTLDPLWQQALLDWQDEKKHKALRLVAASDWTALSALAQRYNGVLRERPQDPVATAALDGLIQAAMGLPPPSRERTQGVPRAVRISRAVFGVVLLAVSGYLFYALMHHGGHK